MKQLELKGQKFGRLLVIDEVLNKRKDGKILWRCVCECGQEKTIVGSDLKRHNSGCTTGCSRRLQLLGQKFGDLIIIKYVGSDKSGQSIWHAQCTCGNFTNVRGGDLKNGNTKSCGCKQGDFKHGLSRTKVYQMWNGAKGHAGSQNLPFTITLEDVQKLVEETFICPLLGISLDKNATGHASNMPSLDKIIPKEGYILNNIWIVSWRANQIKRDANIEELKMLAENLEKEIVRKIINETR